MLFYNFSAVVERYATARASDFKKCVAGQVSSLNIKPKQYDELLDMSELHTGIDWDIDLPNFIKMLRRGDGSLAKAIALYFLFHNEEAFFPAAEAVDHFLFGEGIRIEDKFEQDEFGTLPSFDAQANVKSKTNMSGPYDQGAPKSKPTRQFFEVADTLSNDNELYEFMLRLDWSEQEDAFVFDPTKFPNSRDEVLLDRVLRQLALAGGMVRRGEVGTRDSVVLASLSKIVMGNRQVQSYLTWLHSDDQLPTHADFLDAIILYEALTGEEDDGLLAYRSRAEEIVSRLGR